MLSASIHTFSPGLSFVQSIFMETIFPNGSGLFLQDHVTLFTWRETGTRLWWRDMIIEWCPITHLNTFTAMMTQQEGGVRAGGGGGRKSLPAAHSLSLSLSTCSVVLSHPIPLCLFCSSRLPQLLLTDGRSLSTLCSIASLWKQHLVTSISSSAASLFVPVGKRRSRKEGRGSTRWSQAPLPSSALSSSSTSTQPAAGVGGGSGGSSSSTAAGVRGGDSSCISGVRGGDSSSTGAAC